jgi:hypothetical protein
MVINKRVTLLLHQTRSFPKTSEFTRLGAGKQQALRRCGGGLIALAGKL